jgi:hypothetical protein
MTIVIETDNRSRVVLPGHSNQRFVVHFVAAGPRRH